MVIAEMTCEHCKKWKMTSHAKQKSSKSVNIGRFIARFVVTGEVRFLVLEEVPYIKRSVISWFRHIYFFVISVFVVISRVLLYLGCTGLVLS